ncbi:DUF262 domain-containing protein [Thermoleptolyngbya sp. PKUAC-SCTB121]|uniref:GmrSD restriction endonuclease domain-containing protein n=1 Tax=Thermoleptolyngbya sp. PKUAC-SCTB121 TaxID=2811482 RepID=UPI0019634E2B|nr:DUF262 domain-containing protein [Thermoleptolyngbya sp. PKUAC-SCTB121]
MQLPEPQTKTFPSLVGAIEQGQIKIPQFQRDFVWTMQKSAGLIDSVIKGYPIGTFIFWRTKERLRSVKDIGKQVLPEPEPGDFVDYVLDGQQRLTSLFASLKGITLVREDGREDDFSKIFIDLESEESDQIVITDTDGRDAESLISILDLLTGDFMVLASYPQKYHEKLRTYKNRIESYQYSIIQVKDAPIEIATEIFARINVGGKPLSLFEIMVAKTFDHEKQFDLAEKFQELVDNLKPFDYETISDATVLQIVSIILSKECKRQVILGLDKNDFINTWDKAKDSIERTVEYFKNYYRIPVSQLLPYNALIAPFSYFFFYHPDRPTGDKQRFLEDFFWRCSLSGRYSSSVESKLAQDVKRIDQILAGELPSYDWSIDTSDEFIKNNGWFSTARSYIKAILCIYAYLQPKSFSDNSIVNISNYWLKQANSKNYHHFFPKAHLRKQNYGEFRINHILNITIVDDFLNKREIKAKAPSKYMAKFRDVNPNLEATMKTHLIEDLDTFGIWDDDYDKFFDERAKVVSRELSKRVIKQDIDKQGQSSIVDDFEEELTTVE